MTYTRQTDKSSYGHSYRTHDRWNSYWHQLELLESAAPASVLEVGPGERVVTRELRARGISVTTLDIAADLAPDILGSVTDIPAPDSAYDAVLAAEILEHIRFEDVPKALAEIARVARKHAVISLPHPGYVFSIVFKLPLIPRWSILVQIPFFWKQHAFNGQHYWELGKRGYPISRFLAAAEKVGLRLAGYQKFADDPAHRFFLFTVQRP